MILSSLSFRNSHVIPSVKTLKTKFQNNNGKLNVIFYSCDLMACVWVSSSKLIKFLVKFVNSSKRTNHIFCKNGPIQRNVLRSIRKKPLLFASPLCGVAGEKEKNSQCDKIEEVVHNIALATMALKDGNVEKSKKMLAKTLEFAESNNIPLGVISACDILSSLAMKLGDYEGAEDLLIRALLRLVKEGVPEDDDVVVSFNLKLARIYGSTGNDYLAELSFKNAMKAQRNKLKYNGDGEILLLTTILYWYGKFLQSKNNYKEAKNCFQECYEASLKGSNLHPNQVMVILYNLGEVCQMLGDHEEASEHLLKGVALDKKCKNPDLAYFYNKLGLVSMCKGLYEEAKLWCSRGQKFAARHQNSDGEKESNECLEKINSFLLS